MRNTEQLSLAIAVRRGKEGAVEELVRTYQNRLFGYALRMLQDRFEAQEVTQDVFLRAYHSLAFEYDEEKCRKLALAPWLFRITRNLVLNRLRRSKSRREEPLPDCGGDRPKDPQFLSAESVSDPAIALQRLERQTMLENSLRRLETEARDLILLRFVEGMAYAEIAQVTRTTESAARGKIFRALRKLRTLLEEAHFYEL